jgi:hypothetical protein
LRWNAAQRSAIASARSVASGNDNARRNGPLQSKRQRKHVDVPKSKRNASACASGMNKSVRSSFRMNSARQN